VLGSDQVRQLVFVQIQPNLIVEQSVTVGS
jgi:hypothetical protein